jgi:hypothetical protein
MTMAIRFLSPGSLLLGLAVQAMAVGSIEAQSVERQDYFHHLPAMPPLVTRTAASARFELYGAHGTPLVDVAPVDGIDDARGRRLLTIAARFAPVLRRNNFSAPRFFDRTLNGMPVLQLDTWKRGELVRSDSALLYDPRFLLSASEDAARASRAAIERSDSILEAYVRAHHPAGSRSRTVPAEGGEVAVAFLDFPGEGERSWRAAHRDARDHGTYAHFFVHEDRATRAEARYSFVIQYWFFYPFNDGGNNHEGDWEHLAVLITTPERARAAGPRRGFLTAGDVQRILEPSPGAADSLVIRAVEYYFHESVVVLDYLSARPPRSRWDRLRALRVWTQPDYVANSIHERLTVMNGRLATHPIGYIGGNNKGPDELIQLWPRFQGSYNRNSHGTYPFPGKWQGVGPLGATEGISGATVPRGVEGWENLPDSASLESRFADDHFIAFDRDEIRVVPDWERVAELVLERADVRRQWSWLLLPIRWGYPATYSPGAGAIAHVDVGQVAPEGPAFQPTWNRLADDTGFRVYRPRVMRGLFVPLTPWDRMYSGWGVLNVPVALLGFIPGWSVALTQLGPWLTEPLEAFGVPPPRTFAPTARVTRFSSATVGWHRQFGGRAFARLLEDAHSRDPPASGAETGVVADVRGLRRISSGGLRAALNLHYGPRFTVQNAFAQSRSRLSSVAVDSLGQPVGVLRGTLRLKELTGGFGYVLLRTSDDTFRFFAGGGWGWTWYDLDAVSVDGEMTAFRRRGGYAVSVLPSQRWWPNTWYNMAGLELALPRRHWLLRRVGYGVELRYTGLLHRLGATGPGREGNLGWVTRQELALAAVVSW